VKTGIFGGTFNPIHVGHTALAKNVTESFDLDRMFLVPSNIPPHKAGDIIDPVKRLEMVEMAASKLGGKYIVSDHEIVSEGVSYALNTFKIFRDKYPEDQIFFACGTDIFATIETWHRYEELFDLANFIVVSRSTVSFEKMIETIPKWLRERIVTKDEYRDELFGKIILYEMPLVDVSSTDIRDALEDSYRKLNLPEAVYEYINEKGLYRGNE